MLAVLLALASAMPLASTDGTSPRARFVHFRSPSGNINCLGSGAAPAFVDCLVRHATWLRRPPKPASCDLDWNPTELELVRRHVSVGSCRGDIGPLCGLQSGPGCTSLAYGRSVDIGPIRCSSATIGVTCRYRSAPRIGFRVAREGYTVFRS